MTLYGRKILVKGAKEYLKIKLQEIRKYYPDGECLEIGVDSDHIDLCRVMPPKYSVSKVVKAMKKNTGKSLREEFVFFWISRIRMIKVWGKKVTLFRLWG